MHKLFQHTHSGNFSSGNTALPFSWRCIIATGPTCSLQGADQSWNFHITGKFQQIQAFGKIFQHMLQRCKHLCKTTDHSAGKPIQNEYNKQNKIQQTSSGDIYAGRTRNINFWKRDFSISPQTQNPFKCCSHLLSTKPKSTWSTSAPYCCCSFPVPTSFPGFRIVRTHWFVPAQPHLQLPTDHIRAALQPWSNVCFIPMRAAQTAA